jgi:DNA-binding transcriptional regulator YdaS (Cro superfamily)
MTASTPFESLQAAVSEAGSQSALARICGVSQAAVWRWLQSEKPLPAQHVLAVEDATKISKHLLRPDIYPVDLPSPSSRTDGSITGGAPVVLSDRRAVSDKAGRG